MTGRLADRIVLITGAAGTIGRTVAAAIAQEGGIAIGSDLKGRGAELDLDVTQEDDWRRAVAELDRRHGRLDGLVNSAGIGMLGSVEETDFATWRHMMAVNVDGIFLGCKYAMPLLRRRGGSIVNLSSISGIVAGHNLAAYNASKGAVRLLSKSVALHGARLKPPVRCNSVHPSFVEGDMVDAMLRAVPDPAKAREKMTSDIPLRRFAKPEEVAALTVYLLSDESGFVTGAEFPIDGGLSAR
ncbi:MAG: SDR family oxidoreductase [Bradyrhizobiaceae bacterium]|nr:SDR family oxidoreductase [Bradyrhizobiaceae bacterium]